MWRASHAENGRDIIIKNMGPDTFNPLARAAFIEVSHPLLQPCITFVHAHGQRIILSLNGGFLYGGVTYICSASVNQLSEF